MLIFLLANASTKIPMQENDLTLSSKRIRLDEDRSETFTNSKKNTKCRSVNDIACTYNEM